MKTENNNTEVNMQELRNKIIKILTGYSYSIAERVLKTADLHLKNKAIIK